VTDGKDDYMTSLMRLSKVLETRSKPWESGVLQNSKIAVRPLQGEWNLCLVLQQRMPEKRLQGAQGGQLTHC
jgi:hypothetical protein